MSAAAPLLRVEGLTKRFGGFTAVDGVSFAVAEGEILGLLGPNGSGKSTTFNCIAGMLRPTAIGRPPVLPLPATNPYALRS